MELAGIPDGPIPLRVYTARSARATSTPSPPCWGWGGGWGWEAGQGCYGDGTRGQQVSAEPAESGGAGAAGCVGGGALGPSPAASSRPARPVGGSEPPVLAALGSCPPWRGAWPGTTGPGVGMWGAWEESPCGRPVRAQKPPPWARLPAPWRGGPGDTRRLPAPSLEASAAEAALSLESKCTRGTPPPSRACGQVRAAPQGSGSLESGERPRAALAAGASWGAFRALAQPAQDRGPEMRGMGGLCWVMEDTATGERVHAGRR